MPFYKHGFSLLLYCFQAVPREKTQVPLKYYILHFFVKCFLSCFNRKTQKNSGALHLFSTFLSLFCMIFKGKYRSYPMNQAAQPFNKTGLSHLWGIYSFTSPLSSDWKGNHRNYGKYFKYSLLSLPVDQPGKSIFIFSASSDKRFKEKSIWDFLWQLVRQKRRRARLAGTAG